MGEREFIAGPPAWIEWGGRRWYHNKKDHYYRNRLGQLMHRAIWVHHNGPIPSGGVIHHVDHDKFNNDISNLRLLGSVAEHAREHAEKWEHPNWVANSSSESAQRRARKFWDNRQPHDVTCAECGAVFLSTGMRSKFCTPACKARELRRRRKLEATGQP